MSSDCGDPLDLNQEMRKVLIAPAFSSVSVEGNICCVINCESYSSLEKLLKVICFVKRYARNLKARVGRGECLEEDLTVAELDEAITPSHSLYGRNIARRNFMYFVTEYCEQDNTLLNKYKRLKMMLSHFKKRFYDEYILALRERP